MPKTTVVNVRTDEFDVYIGRAVTRSKDPRCRKASVWGNPFKLAEKTTRDEVMRRYREHIARLLEEKPELRAALKKLKGKRLGCWCKPEACHGDILIELIEGK